MENMLKVELIGYLGADAKVVTQKNTILTFNVGISRRSGDGNNVTTWINCTKFVDNGGGNLTQYMTKGTRVFVRGDLAASAYNNESGAAIPTLSCRVQEIKLLGNERK